MVSLTIVLVLVSLLFPVFSKVKFSAMDTVDRANLSQYYLALNMYAADNDGHFPWIQQQESGLSVYFDNTLLVCPATKNMYPRPVTGGYINISEIFPVLPGQENMPPSMAAWRKNYVECKEMRGSEFPFVLDENHLSVVTKVDRGESFYFILRASGQVQKVPDRMNDLLLNRMELPCAKEAYALNF